MSVENEQSLRDPAIFDDSAKEYLLNKFYLSDKYVTVSRTVRFLSLAQSLFAKFLIKNKTNNRTKQEFLYYSYLSAFLIQNQICNLKEIFNMLLEKEESFRDFIFTKLLLSGSFDEYLKDITPIYVTVGADGEAKTHLVH